MPTLAFGNIRLPVNQPIFDQRGRGIGGFENCLAAGSKRIERGVDDARSIAGYGSKQALYPVAGPNELYCNHCRAARVIARTTGCEIRLSTEIAKNCSRTSSVWPIFSTR